MRSHPDQTIAQESSRAFSTRTPATVFGLDVYANAPVPLLGKPRAKTTGRELELRVEPHDLPWPGGASVVCDERMPDGSVNFRIEAHPEAGYLIWGPTYGRHTLSADGREARCWAQESVEGHWQRLLIAQVLPFATLLRGLEVFHASAVVHEGRAVAFVGPSGSGKTSVALELCRLGGDFLADDVLALEIRDGELLAHPGTPVAGVDRRESERLEAVRRDRSTERRLGSEILLTNPRERLVAMHGADAPAPLGALFFLDRRPDGPPQPRFEPVADPKMLLSATFNFVLGSAERLRVLLDVCSLAAARRVERVCVNTSVDATRVGEAVVERFDSESL